MGAQEHEALSALGSGHICPRKDPLVSSVWGWRPYLVSAPFRISAEELAIQHTTLRFLSPFYSKGIALDWHWIS
jgi:hypothetical protein